ncbi:MAG: UDP-3-O-[3-hydroxymyristoyl] N-acetylglucosamine deacetylase [Rhodospirillaceae bacterium]|nr:UDP-3-O-[3-hydroxymyristoyl] N-acetylglucosamine deacetylase [Rhodospirillaceae bacterium]|tara:strand:- start:12799 stop:13707 length:909 start_codon:yes stop_codon:yes gene_type:complete
MGPITAVYQTTLKTPISCTGIGLHSGEKAVMIMHPAEAGTGIVFERTDLSNGARHFPARFDLVADTFLCTTLRNASGATLSTVEHVMAALAGCGVDNVLIEVSGPELPIMDGSSEAFVFLIECAGIEALEAPRRFVRVLREVQVRDGDKTATLSPSANRSFRCEIVYDNEKIARQSAALDLDDDAFKSDVSRARTFGLMEEIDGLRSQGLALGGSLDNAIVVDGDRVLNEGGLRYDNEFARHKVLDAIGDLALAGAPILGSFNGYCSGHGLNNKLLTALFENDDAWCWETQHTAPDLLAATA